MNVHSIKAKTRKTPNVHNKENGCTNCGIFTQWTITQQNKEGNKMDESHRHNAEQRKPEKIIYNA